MIKRVLTIAGSDSGGGAGIQADLKTFSAFGVYGMSVLTAVTAQNTVNIHGIARMTPEFISLQFEAVLSDIGVDGIKTGMLYDAEIIRTVSRKFKESRIPVLVIDPIIEAKSGNRLLDENALDVLIREWIPLATLVTPNIPEAESLSNKIIRSIEDVKEAGRLIHDMGCSAVLIKGGHLSGDPVDMLYDGESYTLFPAKRINTLNTHGTGCTFSAAVTANLVKGKTLKEAILISKNYVFKAIEQAYQLGKGHGPINHDVRVEGMD